MEQIFEDWEILSCKLHYGWRTVLLYQLFGILADFLMLGQAGGPDPYRGDATWTVRQKSTGIVKRVTASSKSQAADNVANGLFDPD